MRLGGATVQVTGNGIFGRGSYAELGGMPTGLMAPPRPVPPLALQRPGKNYSSPNLSLGPPMGLDGQREISHTADSQQQQQQKNKDEEYESRSGNHNMEGGSGDDQDPDQPPRKKRYHRHTPRQIQEMEMMFKECPHPDDKQRQHLSRELGLEPRQVIEELQREINSIQVERTGAHGESRNPCMSREVERHKAGSVLSS